MELGDARRRLEHYLHAIYGRVIQVEAAGPVGSGKTRSTRAKGGGAAAGNRVVVAGGDVVHLPAMLIAAPGEASPFEQYRVLAVEHAERLLRDAERHGSMLRSALERDLFELAEAASVDRRIVAAAEYSRTSPDSGVGGVGHGNARRGSNPPARRHKCQTSGA